MPIDVAGKTYLYSDGSSKLGDSSDDVHQLTGSISLTGQAYSPIVTLTDASTVSTDCNDGYIFTVTLEGNRALGNPSNLAAGATYIWIIKQDGTGSRTLSYGSAFHFAGGTAPTLTTAAAAVDVLSAVSDGTNVLANMLLDVKAPS